MMVKVTVDFLVRAGTTEEAKQLVGCMLRGEEILPQNFYIDPRTTVVSHHD